MAAPTITSAPPLSHERLLWGTRHKNWRTVLGLLGRYTATVLWRERARYLSAVLAVTFCAVLINVQWGLVLGIYAATSIPVDRASADVWVGAPNLNSVDMGRAIGSRHRSRLEALPEVAATEAYVLDYATWVKPDAAKENCILIGSRLGPGALGAVEGLSAANREQLTEPGAVVIDEADRPRLGVWQVGDTVEVLGQRVRVVGFTQGLKGLIAPYVFCSLETARELLGLSEDQATYFLARCHSPEDADAVVAQLRNYPDLCAYTREDLSTRTRRHWLLRTPGGLATGFLAGLALLVGAAVTRQSLYTATVTALREYAVLRALGIPRRRIALFVLSQSAGVGLLGVALSLPLIYAVSYLAAWVIGIRMLLPLWILGAVLGLTVIMATLSGLATLRSLRLMEPLTLLR
jgi:putative ABC transport system permease protein